MEPIVVQSVKTHLKPRFLRLSWRVLIQPTPTNDLSAAQTNFLSTYDMYAYIATRYFVPFQQSVE